jgi:hypothetical protein
MTETVMRGHGYYNTHSELQARSGEVSDPVLDAALRAATIPASGPLTIADFGCSQGRNSMRPMDRALAALLARTGDDRDVVVIHIDQPHNDFASLFALLEGETSYRRGRPNVFSAAIGRSFYEPLLPARSLTLGWSSIALHWMSHLPVPVADHIWISRGTPAEQAAIAAVAAEDWRAFLGHRMRELVPGGQLVLIQGAIDETGSSGLEALQDAANGVLRALVAEGRLAPETYAAMTLPSRPRTRLEFEAPFAEDALPGLRLEELAICTAPNPIRDRWLADGDDGVFAREMTGFFLAAFSPSLFGDDTALEAAFAERLQVMIAADPAAFAQELVLGILRIARSSD